MISIKNKLFFILIVFFFSIMYSCPNFYGENPSIIIKHDMLDETFLKKVEKELLNNDLKFMDINVENKDKMVLRFNSTERQFKAYELLKKNEFLDISLNILESKYSFFFKKIGGKPMKMGLDLRGGVYLLVKVNILNNINESFKYLIYQLRW